MPDSHCVTDADLSALAVGEHTADIMLRLRAGQVGKHSLLVEALARAVTASGRHQDAQMLRAALALLTEVQSAHPEVAADVLALPHLGFWAADCLARILNVANGSRPSEREPASAELGYLASLAAAAALRADHAFELAVPIQRGAVNFPGHGSSRLAGIRTSGWAKVRLVHQRATATSGPVTTNLPTSGGGQRRNPAGWTPARRLRLRAEGMELSVILETRDPFLAQFGPVADPLSPHELRQWKRLAADAWRIVARNYRPMAIALSAGLSTVVALSRPAAGRAVSASSGFAWGAIAMSLPEDAASFAETLVHEIQHLVLSAVEDITPLVRADDHRPFYAPWRDDPRPVAGLLQGCYAYLGITGLWHRLRLADAAQYRLRGNVGFARHRGATMAVAATLTGAGTLTKTGQVFVGRMREQLAAWQREPVPPADEATAVELAAEHLLRWRLTYLRPEDDIVDAIVSAWLSRQPTAPTELAHRCSIAPTGLTPTTPEPSGPPPSDRLARLLERRYLDRGQPGARSSPGAVDGADAAFLRGDTAQALAGYRQRIRDGNDLGGWVGLILTWRRITGTADDWLACPQPELAAAVYERLRALDHATPRPEALITWLLGARHVLD